MTRDGELDGVFFSRKKNYVAGHPKNRVAKRMGDWVIRFSDYLLANAKQLGFFNLCRHRPPALFDGVASAPAIEQAESLAPRSSPRTAASTPLKTRANNVEE